MKLSEIEEESQHLIRTDSSKEGYEFGKKLENAVRENYVQETHPEQAKVLNRIIFTLYILGLPHLEQELFERIFIHKLKEALIIDLGNEEINFTERLELRYIEYPALVLKETLQEECLPLIRQNEQMIGKQYLNLSTDKPKEYPTIANWLKYYDRETGMGETSNFDRSKFLTNDDSVKVLADKEKSHLRAVLGFYDYLRNENLETISLDAFLTPQPSSYSYTSLPEETSDENSQQEPSKPQSPSQSSSQDKKTQSPSPQNQPQEQSSSETYRPSPSAQPKKSASSQARPLQSSQTINLKELNSKK